MIIVNITGQLGNQMFQYALGKHLELLGHHVSYYLGYYEAHSNHEMALNRIFGIQLPIAKREQYLTYIEDRHRIIDRVRRKLFGKKVKLFTEIGSGTLEYKPKVFEFSEGLVDGYWQSEKYFSPISDVIRQTFRFQNISQQNLQIGQEMTYSNSVSIHVRRGDYLGGFPVQNMDYYSKAMQYFRDRHQNLKFYVFSDDLQWCRTNFMGDDICFVDWNRSKDSPYDMYLMSCCRYNIIANSSFSWWGAWLNNNLQKEVIAPKLWFNHVNTPDVYCDNWQIF